MLRAAHLRSMGSPGIRGGNDDMNDHSLRHRLDTAVDLYDDMAIGIVDARRRAPAGISRRAGSRLEPLAQARRETAYRLALAAEFRDPQMIGHLERVGAYSSVLAQEWGLTRQRCEEIRVASCLHDVGKIGIPDRILQKPGPLTQAERATMQRHTVIGHALMGDLGDELLDLAADIALTHHERLDGSGYPNGLAGQAIPVEGRMVAIADTFDALTSARAYRPAFSELGAIEVLEQGRDSHFDGTLLDCFLTALPEIARATA
jgi:HD-GYP domain-containing protein (c-di-GMP phosphodiesterase class II)